MVPQYPDTIDTLDADATPPTKDTEFLGRAASAWRVRIAFAVLGVAALLLVVRTADLQIRSQTVYARAADANRLRTSLLVPERGRITDRNGVVLTTREQRYAIGITPALLPTGPTRSDTLLATAAAIGVPPEDLRVRLDAYPRSTAEPVVIREHLTHDSALRVYLRSANIPALRILTDEERQYIGRDGRLLESMSHITGYLSRISATQYAMRADQRYRPSDRIGITGVEAQQETTLRGTPGVQSTTVDAVGRVVAVAAQEQPRAGSDVRLTIDVALQEATERALRRGIAAPGARRGVALALDPTTGDVVAMVSMPTFSASAMSRGLTPDEATAIFSNPSQPLFHRAIAGTYPSGSTIKPIVAAAALSHGVTTTRTRVLSTGGIAVEGSFFPDWREGGHGWVTVREAIAHSVNTFFYLIGGGKPRAASARMPGPTQEQALGPERLADALRAFGLGTPTGIDLPGEASGLVPDPAWKRQTRGQDWFIGDTYHLAIGQGDILVTPLQMAVATAAFANGGYRVQSHVVLSDSSPPAGTVLPFASARGGVRGGGAERMGGEEGWVPDQSKIENRKSKIPILPPDALSAIRTAMRAAVTEGSAATLNVFPFPVYGKTGTAEHGKGTRPHAWFVGFAERSREGCTNDPPPPEQSEVPSPRGIEGGQGGVKMPQCIVVVVLIENGGEGSRTAVPVARDMLAAWAASTSFPTTNP